MKFRIAKSEPEKIKADLIVIGCHERRALEDKRSAPAQGVISQADGGQALDVALDGALSKQLSTEKFEGEVGTSKLFFTAGRIQAAHILIVGLGKRDDFSLNVLRGVGAQVSRMASELHAVSAALVLERGNIKTLGAPERARAIVEGFILGDYKFDRYKGKETPKRTLLKTVSLLYKGDPKLLLKSMDEGEVVASATNLARNLVNTPGVDATPKLIAKEIRGIARSDNLTCTIWGPDAIKKAGLSGTLAVSKGSSEPPAFAMIGYKPKGKAKERIALIGKGVTFDAGGISIKPSRGMDEMKGDMGGAATVIATMSAIAKLKPNVEVTAYLPMAENLPDGRAVKPGDIIKMRNGKTVEILNTDAEGRLLLADALILASEKKPDAIVDLATLTGGAAYCVGELYTPIVGSGQKVVDRLIKASDSAGEYTWQLPIVEEYAKGFKSGIADLTNISKGRAQTINAALFLREFVGEDIPWAHLDIAASSWSAEELPLSTKGATGAMVRTLIEFVMNYRS